MHHRGIGIDLHSIVKIQFSFFPVPVIKSINCCKQRVGFSKCIINFKCFFNKYFCLGVSLCQGEYFPTLNLTSLHIPVQ